MQKAVHAEYRHKLESSDTVVLFVHGIQGSPRQFAYMTDALESSCSVVNLLLPGHGGTVKAFNRSSMARWQEYVDEAVRQAQREYRSLFLVGHSMGSLLLAQAALAHPERIRGLFLTATPLVVRLTLPYVRNSLTVALRKERPGERAVLSAARSGKSVTASHPLEHLGGIPRLLELLGTGRALRGQLHKLQMPVIVVQSERDEIVSKRSLRAFDGMPNVRIVTAAASGHYCYAQEAKQRMVSELRGMIRQETGPETRP